MSANHQSVNHSTNQLTVKEEESVRVVDSLPAIYMLVFCSDMFDMKPISEPVCQSVNSQSKRKICQSG